MIESLSLSPSHTQPVHVGWLLLAPEDTDFSSSGHRKHQVMALAVLEIISIRYRPFIFIYRYVVSVALLFLARFCYRYGGGDILCFTSMGFYATLWMRWWGLTCFSSSVFKLFILFSPLYQAYETPSLIPDQKCSFWCYTYWCYT